MKKLLILMILLPLVCFGQTKPHWLDLKNTPIIDVRSYGAKGDGVTDDTDEIQAALDTKQAVLLSSGTYLISAPLIMSSNQMLIGVGSSSILKATTNIEMIRAGDTGVVTGHVIIKDLALSNYASGHSSWNIHMINCGLSDIQNISIINTGTPTRAGIAFDDGAGNPSISGAYVNSITDSIISQGQILFNTFDSHIKNNDIWGAELGSQLTYTICCESVADIQIEGNRISPASGTIGGIFLDGAYQIDITDNYFDGAPFGGIQSGYGIRAVGGSKWINISDNIFASIYRGGIYIQDGDRITVNSNNFVECNTANSELFPDLVVETVNFLPIDILISNNIFIREATVGSFSYAYYESNAGGGIPRVTFRDNIITGRYYYPVFVGDESARTAAPGNKINGAPPEWGLDIPIASAAIASVTTVVFPIPFYRTPRLSEVSVTGDFDPPRSIRVADISSQSLNLVFGGAASPPPGTSTVGLHIRLR